MTEVEWSPDNKFILVGVNKRNLAFVRSIMDPNWHSKIDQGMAGLVSTKWAPSSRHILTVSSFNLRMTVWSLEDKSVQYIPYPKHCGS